MPARTQKKYRQTIDYIEDFVGADISSDEIRSRITSINQNAGPIATDIEQFGGTAQSAVDVAQRIDALFGALEAQAAGELRTRLYGVDRGGTLAEVQAEEVDSTLSAAETAVVTYPSRALNTVGSDELVARVTDSGGTQIDPATVALEDALASNGTDTFQVEQQSPVTLEGADSGGTVATVQADELAGTLGGTETAIITKLSDALATVANDDIRVDLQNTGITQPVDVQAALETTSEDYGVAVDTQVQRTLQIDGFSTVQVLYSGASTGVTVEKTWDQTNYFTVASATGTGSFDRTYSDQPGKYIRVTIAGTGTSGDTGDLVIEGKP